MTILVVLNLVIALGALPRALRHLRAGRWLPAIAVIGLGYSTVSVALAEVQSATLQLAVALGVFLILSVASLGTPKITPSRAFDINSKLLALLFSFGVLAYLGIVARHGVPVFADDPNSARVLFFSNGYISTVFVASLQAVLIAAIFGLLNGVGNKRYQAAMALGALALLFSTGNRGLIVFPLLGLLLFAAYRYRRGVQFAAIAGFVLVIASAVYSFVRNYLAWGDSHIENLREGGSVGIKAMFASDLSYLAGTAQAFDHIIRVFPNEVQHPFGTVFFNALISPLPGKQPTAGEYLKSTLGMEFEGFGLAMGSAGGFYMDFGLFGILVGFAGFAILARWLLKVASNSGGYTMVYFYLGGHMVLMNYAHPIPNLSFLIVPLLLVVIGGGIPSIQKQLARVGLGLPKDWSPSLSERSE